MRRPDAGARKTDFSPIETLQPFPDWHVPVGVGLVGADVVKISGYGVKPGWKEQVGSVQHVHMYNSKTVYRIKGRTYPTL